MNIKEWSNDALERVRIGYRKLAAECKQQGDHLGENAFNELSNKIRQEQHKRFNPCDAAL